MKLLIAMATTISMTCLSAAAQDSHSAHAGHRAQKMSMGDHMKKMEDHNNHMVQMLGPSDAQYDLRFINMMIQHHEGGVAMAENALKNSTHAEIKQMSQKIIDAQKKEIAELKAWRKQWYGK